MAEHNADYVAPRRFVEKPARIEAVQFDGTYDAMKRIEVLVGSDRVMSRSYHPGHGTCQAMSVRTGYTVTTHLTEGDWVARNVASGEVSVFGPDHFAQVFDPDQTLPIGRNADV